MTSKEQELITKLETAVHQLIQQENDLREQCRALEAEVEKREEQKRQIMAERDKMAAQYENLKVARMLELSDDDTRNARQRINRLVREVDKCIALLKA